MSKFFTGIAVDLEAVKKQLPKGAYLERVVWNALTKEVEVHWELQALHTGRDYPHPFTLEALADFDARNALPAGVFDWQQEQRDRAARRKKALAAAARTPGKAKLGSGPRRREGGRQ